MIRLLTRADDAGLCQSVNLAVEKAYTTGIIRNTSLMVNCANFKDAVELLHPYTPGLCIGLHAVINCEWEYPRWGSVDQTDKVPSMLLEDGTFPLFPNDQFDAHAKIDEIMYEIKSQLDIMRATGIEISYIDQHCVFGWLYEYEIDKHIAELAKNEGLVNDTSALKGLPNVDGEFATPGDKLIARLKAAGDGTYKMVTHLGLNNDDMNKIRFKNGQAGKIAAERAEETALVTDEKVVQYCRESNIELIKYTDLTSIELGLTV
ncbi:MAG: ChbG/HpnK family deacetylase [bacterium]